MSDHHEIFVHSTVPEAQFLDDLAAACGSPVNAVDSAWDYAAATDHGAAEVDVAHEFVDDGGIPFDKHEIVIEIRDFERDRARQERTARHVFEVLKKTGRYSLLLTWELQRLLDASPPVPGRALDAGFA